MSKRLPRSEKYLESQMKCVSPTYRGFGWVLKCRLLATYRCSESSFHVISFCLRHALQSSQRTTWYTSASISYFPPIMSPYNVYEFERKESGRAQSTLHVSWRCTDQQVTIQNREIINTNWSTDGTCVKFTEWIAVLAVEVNPMKSFIRLGFRAFSCSL